MMEKKKFCAKCFVGTIVGLFAIMVILALSFAYLFS